MSLVIPGVARPTNLVLPPDAAACVVENDLYHVCDDIAKISRRLYILLVTDGRGHSFIIMEKCEDGVDRLVYRVEKLDGRVLRRLREMMARPLEERVKILEKENYAFEQAEAEREFEELYESLGRPMWTQLEHDGFVQRGVSYPKRGVKATTRG